MNTIDLQELIDKAFSYYTEDKPWIVELLEAQGRVFNPLRFDDQCLKLMKDGDIQVHKLPDNTYTASFGKGNWVIDTDYNKTVLLCYIKMNDRLY